MRWEDEGIVLAARPHGETAVIAEVFSRTHGRHRGLVQGGRSRRTRPVLQTGNHVRATWAARLDEQLGQFALELVTGFAATVMDRPLPLLGVETLAAMAGALPERDPHPNLFEISLFVLKYLEDDAVWPALYARWELALLAELGFALDLDTCAATGTAENLIYVSPRTGRAVSAAAGAPYRDKLLPLPPFLRGGSTNASVADVRDALQITGTFLSRWVLTPEGKTLPDCRHRLVSRLTASHPPPVA